MKVTVEDIKKIPTNGVLQVKLENMQLVYLPATLYSM